MSALFVKTFKNQFLPISKFTRPGKPLQKVLAIVVHNTGAPGQNPDQVIRWWSKLMNKTKWVLKFGNTFASAHFIVSSKGDVVQTIPWLEVAYHCGARKYRPGIIRKLGRKPNLTTIGIEICHETESGRFTDAAFYTAAKLVAWLLQQNPNLKIDDVYRHYDITGKMCPRYFVENEYKWKEFLQSVENSLFKKV